MTWTLETGGSTRSCASVWSEFGAAPPRVPVKGFGTLLLERGLEQGLGGEALLDWRDTGLVATLSIRFRPIRGARAFSDLSPVARCRW